MDEKLFVMLGRLEMEAANIQALDPDSAKFVSMLAISKKVKTIVEVGAGHGYSTLWLAYAASLTGGKVITCENNETKAAEAQANVDKAGLSSYVEIITGDAREELRHRDEAIDFVFLDGEAGQYETYFDVVYKRLGLGAMIVADDVVESENDLSDYVTYVQNHPNLESVTVPLGDGLEITVKTGE
ncbi:MAG: O-methyltransferase [Chloroflexota bacterium]